MCTCACVCVWCVVCELLPQDSNTSDMTFSCAEIISFLSQGITLEPGTVILTGTPEGVGYTVGGVVAWACRCTLRTPVLLCLW